ncbi:MAG: nucleotidyltransferase domain-containing protein [Hyphomicrobiaceae bacterium]
MTDILELDGNQRRHLINVQQIFNVWREARTELRRAGGMHWKTGANGHRYLYATLGRKERSLGSASPEAEQIFAAHTQQVDALKSRVEQSRQALDKTARVSKALYLGRLPTIAARILRKLDDAGLLGGSLLVVGTNALFAYEAGTGVLLGDTLIATEDLDLLWDPRHRMSLLVAEGSEAGVLGLLQQVDKSFKKSRPYQAANDESYLVDLIRPMVANEMFKQPPRLSEADDEFDPAPIDGLAWLVSAPRYEDIAIAEDGLPARIVTVDPRAYALHKLWLSRRGNRRGLKRARDFEQARAVAELAVKWLDLSFQDTALTALPVELMQGVAELEAFLALEKSP